MKKNTTILTLPLAALLTTVLLTGCEEDIRLTKDQGDPSRSEQQAVVSRVVDGDTLEVELEGEVQKVRVLGIDTPEVHGGTECGGPEASEYVTDHWLNQEVELVADSAADDTDRYGRLLRHVQSINPTVPRDLGQEIISDGWAIAYHPDSEPEPDDFAEYEKAQQEAENERRGAWGMGCQMTSARP